MTPKLLLTKFRSTTGQSLVAVLCVLFLVPGKTVVQAQQPAASPEQAAPKIPNDQLDSLVAPIALYPDPLLSQTLVASTYPLEIIQLEQWMKKNKDLKGKALADAVEKQKWDPSIQSMAALPDVVKQLAGNISWTTDLGNAFLAQQSDVMDAVQRMRAKAQGAGNLKSSQQQKVETKTVESKTVIVIEQADPQVVYVPTYSPTVVYGAPVYPYPPITYPPGYGLLAFGTGVAIGAAWGNGGWGYGCGWGSNNNITINNNNNFVNHYNKNNINNANRTGGGNKWQHSPQHRGSAPYGDRNTANRFGGNARQQPAGGLGNRPGGDVGAGIANRPGGGTGIANRPGGGDGIANRPGGGAGANRPGGGAGASRPSGGTGIGAGGSRPSTMPATRPSGGGADRIGNQNLGGSSRGGASSNVSSRGGGFGGGGGASASRASSSRGGSSMGGGGFSRGGGGGGRRR